MRRAGEQGWASLARPGKAGCTENLLAVPPLLLQLGLFFWRVKLQFPTTGGLGGETEGWLLSACEPASVQVSSYVLVRICVWTTRRSAVTAACPLCFSRRCHCCSHCSVLLASREGAVEQNGSLARADVQRKSKTCRWHTNKHLTQSLVGSGEDKHTVLHGFCLYSLERCRRATQRERVLFEILSCAIFSLLFKNVWQKKGRCHIVFGFLDQMSCSARCPEAAALV